MIYLHRERGGLTQYSHMFIHMSRGARIDAILLDMSYCVDTCSRDVPVSDVISSMREFVQIMQRVNDDKPTFSDVQYVGGIPIMFDYWPLSDEENLSFMENPRWTKLNWQGLRDYRCAVVEVSDM